MSIIPQNNYILCKKYDTIKNKFGTFVVDSDSFNMYQILQISKNASSNGLKENDVVVVNSTGTKVKKDDDIFYLFNIDSIVASIEQ